MWKWEAEGQPKAVVAIIHNAYEHHSRYAWFIQQLRNHGFHVVMGDLPGHGAQMRKNYHDEKFETYAHYVKQLFEVGLADGLPLFVLGHGLGATLVIRALQKEKIECAGIVISSPWLQLQHHPAKYSSVLSKLTSSSMKINHDIGIEMLTRNEEIYPEAREDSQYESTVSVGWYRELQSLMKTVLQHEGVIQDVPVLLHVAGEDQITDIAIGRLWLVNQNLSEFQYKNWKRMYHDVYHEIEREELFLYTKAFMHSTLRSLGYVV